MSAKDANEIVVNEDLAVELGLTRDEYKMILDKIGRTPTYTELGVYSVMWSEHCSYKNSIVQLKKLPKAGERILVEAGEENAGLVDIGDGYAIAFKIESHNHPSAIVPFEGAATGVGGILRDIFTMGARPIAALNSLRFGELENERTQYLFKGVVSGISHYGNCFGVPTVGGEVYFDKCYQDNPLVNAMAVGIVKTNKTATAAANGVGNPVFIIGSKTGRDGIHGASLLASREFDEKTDDMRPSVQVGDPFEEKLLLEATLELIEAGVITGIQDMGAAGISCSTSEMSEKSGVGMHIDLNKVPLRESGMSAYEIMLSESQERMLAVVEKDKIKQAKKIAEKWDVPFVEIGYVSDDGMIKLNYNGEQVAELDAESLVLGGGAPVYHRKSKRPAYLDEKANYDLENLVDDNLQESFKKLISSPTIASKRWVFEQYDSQVRTNTVSIKGDAAIIRLKELPGKAIAVSTDCNSRFVYLDPYSGGQAAVCEAARNVACVGAEPVAITNCLNYGNPYDEEVYYTFEQSVKGMGDACKTLKTPVTGGNVSFHNESREHAVFPTPTIGMLGIIDDLDKIMSSSFKESGDDIFLIGNNREELGGSEYVKMLSGEITGKSPIVNVEDESRLIKVLLDLCKNQTINSAHDTSEGGLAVCLAEKLFGTKDTNNLGCDVDLPDSAEALFGESHGRVIVSLSKSKTSELESICKSLDLGFWKIGTVTGDGKIKIGKSININISEIKDLYENAIPKIMNK
jgi:phosphoribosylformylglycinamidine synthase subunit PurL